MTEDQLSRCKKLQLIIKLTDKTLTRIESLKLSWAQNGTTYHFSRSEFDDNTEIIEIFKNVEETAKTLLQKQIEKYQKNITNEFEKL